jgi:hypothetical protein
VTYRPHIHMRLRPLKLLLRHRDSSSQKCETGAFFVSLKFNNRSIGFLSKHSITGDWPLHLSDFAGAKQVDSYHR